MSNYDKIESRQIIVDLLKAGSELGSDGEVIGWYYPNLYSYIHIIGQAAKELARKVRELDPDYICALRTSGLLIALLTAIEANKKFIWFVEPEADSLFPGICKRDVRLNKASVMMIDTHVVTGGTLLRHAIILDSLGAKLYSPCVLFNCDSFGGNIYRLNICESWFEERLGGVHSIAQLSHIEKDMFSLYEMCSDMEPFFNAMRVRGSTFWECPRTISQEEDIESSPNNAIDRFEIPLLNRKLANEILGLMRVEVPYRQHKRKAIEPWELYYRKDKLISVCEEVTRWWSEKGKRYTTIAAASYWGLPLAILLSSLINTIDSVVCLDDEIMAKPTSLTANEVFLVDDVIKRGTDLGYALRELERLGSCATQCLVVLDNGSFPWRGIPREVIEKVEIKAITRID